jgi:hypothetical protein
MKSILYKLLGFIAIDFLIMWFLVYRNPLDPSVAIGIVILVPFVFLLNILVCIIFFRLKQREYASLFLVNSILASAIMYFMFDKGIDKYQNDRLESWEFSIADTTYSLTRWKKENEFSLSYSLNAGSSTSFLGGTCELVGNDWVLKADSMEMRIHQSYLIGFRTSSDTIKMVKEER